MTASAATPTIERGRDRLENWALWSRLDGADTGFPRKCSYWTPPRAGDTYDEEDGETLAVIDTIDAERTEKIVVSLDHTCRQAVRARYLERRAIEQIARIIRSDRQRAQVLLAQAEHSVGRG